MEDPASGLIWYKEQATYDKPWSKPPPNAYGNPNWFQLRHEQHTRAKIGAVTSAYLPCFKYSREIICVSLSTSNENFWQIIPWQKETTRRIQENEKSYGEEENRWENLQRTAASSQWWLFIWRSQKDFETSPT